MNDSRLRKPIVLTAFIAAVVVCAMGVASTGSRLIFDAKAFEKNDVLVSMWNIPLESEAHCLFLFRFIDESGVNVAVERVRERKTNRIVFDGETQQVVPIIARDTLALSLSPQTVKRFGGLYLLGIALSCGLFLFAALFVELKSPASSSVYFSLSATLIAVMIATAQARFETQPFSVSGALRAAFLFSCALAPVFFLRWSRDFPKANPPSIASDVAWFYLPMSLAIALATYAVVQFHDAVLEKTYPFFRQYHFAANGCRAFFALLALGAAFNLARAYARLQDESDLRRLRWTLVGLGVGATPFVLLSLVQNVFFDVSLATDALAVAFAAPAPLMLAIAITRYRLLDTDELFAQSFIFLATLGALGLLYALVVFLLSQLFAPSETHSPYVVAAFAAVLVLICFEPIKAQVQAFANERVFKARFNARRAEVQLATEIQTATDEDDLAERLAERLYAALGVSLVAIAHFTRDGKRLKLFAERNFVIGEPRSVSFPSPIPDPRIVARKERVEEGIAHRPADEKRFARWDLALAVPIVSESETLGYILLGEKNFQLAFNAEEIALLQSVAKQTATMLSRLRLQRDLALKSEEAQRLRELSDLKSHFVSSVSHDLRTPLTSIKLFAEMLAAKTDDETSKKYLSIIEGESERLSKMVANILRFAKSEKGMEAYRFETLNLSALAEEALRSLAYQLELGAFQVKTRYEQEPLWIEGDKTTLLQAIENLLSNAMKYSGESKTIELATFKSGEHAILSVKDFGIGISEADQTRLFEPFFRSSDERAKRVGGVGLGLALVKNVMNAHRGEALVKSIVGEGSEFELRFPPKAS